MRIKELREEDELTLIEKIDVASRGHVTLGTNDENDLFIIGPGASAYSAELTRSEVYGLIEELIEVADQMDGPDD